MRMTDHIRVDELLTDELLETFRSRAPEFDATSGFPYADFEQLDQIGYLRAGVPSELGGLDLSFAELGAAQRRLAAAAPATALSVNMHQIWVSVARRLWDAGDRSLEAVLRSAVAGEVFAFGISEPGNEDVLFDSKTVAKPTEDGGYTLSGLKIFTTATPAWTRLGLHARIDGTNDLVFGFVEKTPGVTALDDWDTLGMRATQSQSTRLDGALIAKDAVAAILPAQPSADPLRIGIFGAFELLIADVYLGIADRALELAIEASATPRKNTPRKADDPLIRRRIGEAALALDGASAHVALVSDQFGARQDKGFGWFRPLVAAKTLAVRAATTVVEEALAVAGGAAFFTKSELSRLSRDVRAGGFHPSSNDKAIETIAGSLLGPITRLEADASKG